MSPIEWTRLTGEQVEELAAVLLCRKFPAATLIRPSAGDGGLDVVIPQALSGNVVYQVKKFASNLTGQQKRQIKHSLERLEQYRAANDFDVVEWHLTLPLNPTNENRTWLSELLRTCPIRATGTDLTSLTV